MESRPPAYLFWLELTYLGALFAIFVLYIKWHAFSRFVPRHLGDLPTATIWFGATGAVLISLTGIFLHSRNWNAAYNEWHIARPLLGAVVGPVGCLILVVVVEAANTRGTRTNDAFYDVVAFLVGYREETFRELIKRATDVILAPNTSRSRDRRQQAR